METKSYQAIGSRFKAATIAFSIENGADSNINGLKFLTANNDEEMNGSSMQFYAQMQLEIHRLQQFTETEILMIEGCFSIAARYWYDIQTRVELYAFKEKKDELYFYKNIKPLFTGVMEYYSSRYKAVLFRPAWGRSHLAQYWMNELKRIERFYNSNREFYQYWQDGGTNKDDIYFSRPVEPVCQPGKRMIRKKLNSFYDDLIARLLGYQEYRKYIEAELEELGVGGLDGCGLYGCGLKV